MGKIVVLSHSDFDERFRELGLDDSNIEDKDVACVSIIGTPECLKYYLDEEDTVHYFSDHSNVLNLDFDDLTSDFTTSDGHVYRAMTKEQADAVVRFLDENLSDGDKDLYVHCRAGMSRSRAVAEFAKRRFPDMEYNDRGFWYNFLNKGVLSMLTNASGYEYPEDNEEDGV